MLRAHVQSTRGLTQRSMRRVDHVHIKMADLSHQRVPKAWNQSTSPAWTIQLNSALKIWPRLLNPFPTVLDRCVLCSRGAFVQSGTYFPKQRHHIVDWHFPRRRVWRRPVDQHLWVMSLWPQNEPTLWRACYAGATVAVQLS